VGFQTNDEDRHLRNVRLPQDELDNRVGLSTEHDELLYSC
jgi:hypothetical protein